MFFAHGAGCTNAGTADGFSCISAARHFFLRGLCIWQQGAARHCYPTADLRPACPLLAARALQLCLATAGPIALRRLRQHIRHWMSCNERVSCRQPRLALVGPCQAQTKHTALGTMHNCNNNNTCCPGPAACSKGGGGVGLAAYARRAWLTERPAPPCKLRRARAHSHAM